MSSELYWENLGIKAPEPFRQAVVHNAREMFNYLKRAEQRLFLRKYVFKFKVQEILIVPSGASALAALKKAKGIYFDIERRRRLRSDSIIDPEQMLVSLDFSPSEWFLFADVDGHAMKVEFRVQKALLSDLEPVEVSEEEEDLALDLMFEQSEYVYDAVSSERSNIPIKILDRRRNERTITLGALPKESKIAVRYNTYVMEREYQALEALALHPKQHQLPLLNLLQKTWYATWEDFETDPNIEFRILNDVDEAGTEEQREFVRKALKTPDFAILEGPPGSGKTTTILEIILQLVPQHKRVVLVASTHVAVDNVIEKLIETSEDGMTLIEKYGVVPLRVGSTDNVSEKVLKYHIENFVESERKRLLKFLGKLRARTDSQQVLYESLSNEDRSKAVVENLALESANLVCGTTIGVLQSRFIKESNESKPPFDYLILDEASKTTFQEFLVPALHASRWILSGDIKQLAPYVDQVPIRENLANLHSLYDETGKEDKKVCVDVFCAADRRPGSSHGRLVVYADDADLPRRYEEQARAVEELLSQGRNQSKAVGLCVVSDGPKTIAEKLQLTGSSLVLVPKSKLNAVEDALPPHLHVDQFVSDSYSRRKSAFLSYLRRAGLPYDEKTIELWEDQVAWRLSRLYELRNLKEKQEEYLLELRLLLPHFERDDESFSIRPELKNGSVSAPRRLPRDEFALMEIRRIERIALPSVLELLQKGYRQNEGVDEQARVPLYDGLPDRILKQRHTLLAYQHRMHPEISRFPREHIYSNEALKDSPDIQILRNWTSPMYANRHVWVNVSPGYADIPQPGSRSNYNLAELRVISSHLKRFTEWSRHHPSEEKGSEGYWKVALLSFYKGQENKLAETMRNMFGSRAHGYFESRTNNLKVEVCTVDRFQGHEADLVFLSLVNNHYKIGFLDNPNRLNVALTRAKYQLVIVGDRQTFKCSKQTTELLQNLERLTPEGPIEFGGT
jgi:superfamily I DNA and/or RNA helicase